MIAAVTTRITLATKYYEVRDSISHDLMSLILRHGMTPLLIPNICSSPEKLYNSIPFDVLILSGGDDLVKPIEKISKINNIKILRDTTEKKLIKFSIKKNIPIIGICRGMQLLNNFFGGYSNTSNNSSHKKEPHLIKETNNLSLFPNKTFKVNSFHNNIITKTSLSPQLIPTMLASDNSVESFMHNNYSIFGIMWHPERKFIDDAINTYFKERFFVECIKFLMSRK